MPTVNTMRGPVDTASLGFTLMHEHVIVRSWGVFENWPHLWDPEAEVKRAVQLLGQAKAAGVDTILDLTTVDLGRDIPRLQQIADSVEINIIVATGVWMAPPAYIRRQEIDTLASMFVHDIEEGIAGTGVRAGAIKVATEPEMDEVNEKILRAAARAHRRTGVPISTHTLVRNRTGSRQQDIFESEGVDLSRVVIGHSGDGTDVEYLESLIDRGSYLGMDRFGLDRMLDTEQRVQTIAKLCQMGHADKMVLSHDANCYMDIIPQAAKEASMPNWSYVHIPNDVVPALASAGVSQAQIDAMTRDNPRRIFEAQDGY
ncbi:MAG: phosphotriesterase-related protein [Dehalococcoidia bacterium]